MNEVANIDSKGYGFQIEVKYKLYKLGMKIEEAPIIFPDRKKGVSKMNLKLFPEAIIKVIKLRLGI